MSLSAVNAGTLRGATSSLHLHPETLVYSNHATCLTPSTDHIHLVLAVASQILNYTVRKPHLTRLTLAVVQYTDG